MARLRWSPIRLFLASAGLLILLGAVALAQDAQPPATSTSGQSNPSSAVSYAPIPDPNASAAQLETQGDQLRSEKRYLDSTDFYHAALKKQPSLLLWNKTGMSYLMMRRIDEARKCFDHALKMDKSDAPSLNNRGFIEQAKKKYAKAIRYYEKALKFRADDAVFYYNMGTSYFGMKDYKNAAVAYGEAFKLDPDIMNRVSRSGWTAQSTSPEDRATFSFLVAKVYAQAGDVDHSLEYLRKAMEDGYKDIRRVYTDSEFATLRTDKRFEELMAQRPQAIP